MNTVFTQSCIFWDGMGYRVTLKYVIRSHVVRLDWKQQHYWYLRTVSPSLSNNLKWYCVFYSQDAPQYPGYSSHYWYPQSHSTGHYSNNYPSGSEVQPQYNPQVKLMM